MIALLACIWIASLIIAPTWAWWLHRQGRLYADARENEE